MRLPISFLDLAKRGVRTLVPRGVIAPAGVLAASLLAVLCGGAHAATPRPALSTTPAPFNWVVPPMIPVVGHDANGVPDARGEVVVFIRDLANLPVPNSLVTLDFSGCPDLRLCTDSHDPDAVLNCALASVSKFTDVNGSARFRVVGCSVGIPGSPGSPWNCARIYADGVLGGSPYVASYDLVGCDGLTPVDISAWLEDFFGGNNPPRADLDGSGDLGAGDLGRFLDAFFASGSLLNCSPGGLCGP